MTNKSRGAFIPKRCNYSSSAWSPAYRITARLLLILEASDPFRQTSELTLPDRAPPAHRQDRQSTPPAHHPSHNMIGRSALKRGARLALRRQDCAKLTQRRAHAAAAAGASTETASFDSTEINGIKVASRDPRSATTRLAVVAKAGTRYQPMPGLSVGLEEFAFKASQPVTEEAGRE